MARAPGGTTSSLSGSGDQSSMRRFISGPTTRSARPAPQSAGTWPSTTSHHKTHSTAAGDEVTVVYAWHPWAGRPVRLHEVIERATGASARCSLVDATNARLQEIPVWMLDALVCRTTRTTAQPVAALPALAALRALLSDATRGAPTGAAVASPESCGDRHATPSSPAAKAAPSTRPRPDEPAARCCRDPTGGTRGPIEVAGQPSV